MQTAWFIILILFANSCWSDEQSCVQVKQPKTQCDVLNISSKVVISRSPTEFDVLMLQIDSLSMLYPDGEVTRMLGRITESVSYEMYHDKILRIPADSQLTDITVKSAPQLQTIRVSGANNALESLYVAKSTIRRIPTTLRHLKRLKILTIEHGFIDTVSVEPLQGIYNLTEINLSHNKLRRLEVSKDPMMILPNERLYLTHNRLEFIDMEFFTPFKMLSVLDLTYNRLKQMIANRPVALPRLLNLQLTGNQLMQLNVSNWNAPKLGMLDLSMNNLTQLPFGIDHLTDLDTVAIDNNQLTVLDLQQLEGLRKLTSLRIGRNRLHTILPDCQPPQKPPCLHVSMPVLNRLFLSHNDLRNIDFMLWNMPSLRHLTLDNNRLQRLHIVPQKFPNMKALYISNNFLRCSDIRSMKIYLEKDIIGIGVEANNSTCATNSSIPHPIETGVICCND